MMCWWPCCGGWVTTRHYETNTQKWKKDHGRVVYAVASRGGKILSGGDLALFSHVHEIRLTLNGEPTSGTFDLLWGGETIGTGLSITVTASEIAALLDAAEITNYVEATGGPLNTTPIIIRMKDTVVTTPGVSTDNESHTGGTDPEIVIDEPAYACRRYSATGSLEEKWHEEVVTDIDIGVATGELIYLADGGVHVYDADLSTILDTTGPWNEEVRRIDFDEVTEGFRTVSTISAPGRMVLKIDTANASVLHLARTDDSQSVPSEIMKLKFDSSGNLYVWTTDYLQKFDPDGALLWKYDLGTSTTTRPTLIPLGLAASGIAYTWVKTSGSGVYIQSSAKLIGHNPDGSIASETADIFTLPANSDYCFMLIANGRRWTLSGSTGVCEGSENHGSQTSPIDKTYQMVEFDPATGEVIGPASPVTPDDLYWAEYDTVIQPSGHVVWQYKTVNSGNGQGQGSTPYYDLRKGIVGTPAHSGTVTNSTYSTIYNTDFILQGAEIRAFPPQKPHRTLAGDSSGNLYSNMFAQPTFPFLFSRTESQHECTIEWSHAPDSGSLTIQLPEISDITCDRFASAATLNADAANNPGGFQKYTFSGGPLGTAPITIQATWHQANPTLITMEEYDCEYLAGLETPFDFRFSARMPFALTNTGDKKCFYLDPDLNLVEVVNTEPGWSKNRAPNYLIVDPSDRVWIFYPDQSNINHRNVVVKDTSGNTLFYPSMGWSFGQFRSGQNIATGFYNDQTSGGIAGVILSSLMYYEHAGNPTLATDFVSKWDDANSLEFSIPLSSPTQVDSDSEGCAYVASEVELSTGETWNLAKYDADGDRAWTRYHGAELRACKTVGESLYVGGDLSCPIYLETHTVKYQHLRVSEPTDHPAGTYTLNFSSMGPDVDLEVDVSDSSASLETEINDMMDTEGASYSVSVTGGPLSSGVDLDLVWDGAGGPAITIKSHKLTPTYTIRRYELDGTFVCGFGTVPVNSIDAISEELIIAAGEVGNSGLKIETTQEGDESTNCIQTLTGLQPIALSFKILRGEEKSTSLSHEISAADLQAALEDISSIGDGNVSCTGGPLDSAAIAIEFIGDLELMAISLLEIESADTGTTRRYSGAGVLEKVWNHKAEVHSAWVDRDDTSLFETGGGRVQE